MNLLITSFLPTLHVFFYLFSCSTHAFALLFDVGLSHLLRDLKMIRAPIGVGCEVVLHHASPGGYLPMDTSADLHLRSSAELEHIQCFI